MAVLWTPSRPAASFSGTRRPWATRSAVVGAGVRGAAATKAVVARLTLGFAHSCSPFCELDAVAGRCGYGARAKTGARRYWVGGLVTSERLG